MATHPALSDESAAAAAAPTPPSPSDESHPGISLETSYAEAVLAFNSRNFPQTLQIIEGLLKQSPRHLQALELQALTYKSQGDDAKTLEAYQRLIRLKPEKEQGPYFFDSGVIYFKRKKYDLAKSSFESAIRRGFNTGASRFFLGTVAFTEGDLGQADREFSQVPASDAGDDLKAASHFYLGQIHFKSGYGTGGTHEMMAARELALKIAKNRDNKLAADIAAAATRVLQPYDRPQWFGNVSFLGQYDGNVALLSNSNTAPDQTQGKRTGKLLLIGGLGRMSSPMNPWQLVGSWRFTVNKNTNSDASEYEFATNTLSLYLTRDPLAATQYGVKGEGSYAFQNRRDTSTSSTGASAFRPYSLAGELGPYVRTELARRVQLTFEAFYRPQRFQDDPETGISRRSGRNLLGRATVRKNTAFRYFNPDASLSWEKNDSEGTDFRSTTWSVGLGNGMRFGDDTFTLSADFGVSSFRERQPGRLDRTTSLRVSWLRAISPRWGVLGDLSWSHNASTIPELYTYTRPTFSIGVSYSL